MKPVMQDKFSHNEGEYGNCFTACLASILEMNIEDVPNFIEETDGKDVIKPCNKWLNQFGLSLLWIQRPPRTTETMFWWYHTQAGCDMHYIMAGKSPRQDKDGNHFKHACVGKLWNVVHDPHPDGGGIADIDSYYFILALPETARMIIEFGLNG